MKACRERLKSVLNLAVLLKDETTSDKNVIGEVFLKAHNLRKKSVRHSTGYFLFIDIPEGKYQFTAGGKMYELKEFDIDTGSVNPQEPFFEQVLRRKTF